MGRKRRLDKQRNDVKHKGQQNGRSVLAGDSLLVERGTDDNDDSDDSNASLLDETVPIETILAQCGSDREYLRLRSVRGDLPLSFYEHDDLRQVRILNLRGCDLTTLHPRIVRLRSLKYLDVSENPRIRLPAQLARCNLTRFAFSPDTVTRVRENHRVPYTPRLNRDYCGDLTHERMPRLSHLAARAVVDACSAEELDDLRERVPAHLRDSLLPTLCAECGAVGRRIVATRVRNAVVAFNTVPLHYTLCSPTCLARIQQVWALEEILNDEKRALRLQKFGRTGNNADLQQRVAWTPEYAYA